MVIHFVIDEKVTDQIIENFSEVDKTCFFLIFSTSDDDSFKYVQNTSDKLIKFNHEVDDINAILKTYKATAILTHAFHLEYAKTILKIKQNLKIAWYIWGFDVYGLPHIKPSTYANTTNNYLLKTLPELKIGRVLLKHQWLRKLFYKLKGEEDRYTIIFKALKKVSYFVTYLEGDFKYYSKYYDNNFTYISCPFSTIDQYLAGNKDLKLKQDASNILIGNSNSLESNHVDAFKIINKHGIDDNNTTIYVPLSYGDDLKYKDFVIENGENLLGPSFNPMLDFMDRTAYIEILRSCSVGVFYHYRQQAMGNIIAMLYLGSRVYLSRNNPSYEFFVSNGILIFDFDEDFKTHKNKRLEDFEILNNRNKLDLVFNEDRVYNEMTKLLNIIR
ncbi:MAG: TDP-N-acetylfucosamine:lipid II N-acetylfucosaminyltransferase [Winogradskyella arenosi]